MPQRLSARELKRIREKYSHMAEDDLLQVRKENIIGEAQEILASELRSRGWDDQQRIDARRSELEKPKQKAEPGLDRPTGSRAMKVLATIFGSLAFAAMYTSCDSRRETSWGGVVFGLLLAVVSSALYSAASKSDQVLKDSDAGDRVESILKGEEPLFYLYLRPFSITNKLRMSNPRMALIQDSLKPDRFQDFESVLTAALSARGIPLVGLGRPGEAVGAGRIRTTDENWQSIFESLANAASGFIVVPALTSGTWWEIDWLVQHKLIHKTVFLLPESHDSEKALSIATEYRKLSLDFPKDGVKSHCCPVKSRGAGCKSKLRKKLKPVLGCRDLNARRADNGS